MTFRGQGCKRMWTKSGVRLAAAADAQNVARPERLELPTPRFVVWCSIQLSYGRTGRRRSGANPSGKAARWQAARLGARSGLSLPLPSHKIGAGLAMFADMLSKG